MKIIDRIFQYIDYKGIKPIPFEKEIGLSNGYLGKQQKRNADLGESIILKIIENCPEINPYWLLTGEGEMLKTKSEEFTNKKNVSINVSENVSIPKVQKTLTNVTEEENIYPLYNKEEYRAVMRKIKFAEGVNLAEEGAPFYPLPVSAGNASQLLDEAEKPTGYLSIPGMSCKAYFPVIGFSFEPLIRAGDIIGIDFINRWEVLDPDCIYFIVTQDQRMIKRLSDDPDNPDRLICISPNHKEFPIYKSDIKAIHKVIFYGRLV